MLHTDGVLTVRGTVPLDLKAATWMTSDEHTPEYSSRCRVTQVEL
jgi:hypothetical protein